MGKVTEIVTDLGAAAFLVMHKYKVADRRGKAFYFEIDETEVEQFQDLNREYLFTEFHRFDACIMSLKKLRESSDKY